MWLDAIFTSSIVEGFSSMILHSLWQGSVIAFMLAITLKIIPEKKSALRFNLSAFALFTMFVLALVTFLGAIDTSDNTGSGILVESVTYEIITFDKSLTWTNYGVIIWLVGLVILFIRLLLGYSFIFKLSSRSTEILGPAAKSLAVLKQRLHLLSKVRLVESARVAVPMTIGHLKPIILLPLGLVTNLTPMQIEAIIAHELAHIKRNDYVMNLIYSFIEIIFYYHPAIWWVSAQMQHEREANCDDLAIALTGNKKNYLSTLYTLQQAVTPKLAMTMLGRNSSLLKRFNRQINSPIKKSKTMEKLTICCLLFIALVGLSFKSSNLPKEIRWDLDTENNVEIIIFQDTIPKNKKTNRSKIVTKVDGTRYQLETENGDITLFKKDGKTIAPKDYGQYADLIDRLRDLPVPTPPTPPGQPAAPSAPAPPAANAVAAPRMPSAPAAPLPVDPGIMEDFPAPPTPPAAPTPEAAPIPPAAPAAAPTPPAPPAPPAPLDHEEEMMVIQGEIDRMQQEEIIRVDQEVIMAAREQELARLQALQEVEEAGKLAEINLTLDQERHRVERLNHELVREAVELERQAQEVARELQQVEHEKLSKKDRVLRNE